MSARALRQALESAGCAGRVEERGQLAILITRDPTPLVDENTRQAMLRLAIECGFTHLAVELDDATPPGHTAALHRAEYPG